MDMRTAPFQLIVREAGSGRLRRSIVRCAVTFVISAGLFVSVSLNTPYDATAGLSGPGGPRLNYEYMPRIEDYEPLPEGAENGGHTPPPVPHVKSAPEPPSPPVTTGVPPTVQQQGVAPRKQRDVQHPRTTSPSEPPRQAIPNPKASSKSRPRAERPGSRSLPPKAKADKDSSSARAQRKQILTRLYGYLSDAKDKSQAMRLARSIEELWLHSGSPTTDLLMKRTDRAIETGRWQVAETFTDAIVKLQPGYTEGWMRRALVLYQRRRPTRALRSLRRVLAIDPNHFLALDRVGAILESVGEYKPALEAYRKLKRLHPQAPGVVKRIEELTRKVEGEQI